MRHRGYSMLHRGSLCVTQELAYGVTGVALYFTGAALCATVAAICSTRAHYLPQGLHYASHGLQYALQGFIMCHRGFTMRHRGCRMLHRQSSPPSPSSNIRLSSNVYFLFTLFDSLPITGFSSDCYTLFKWLVRFLKYLYMIINNKFLSTNHCLGICLLRLFLGKMTGRRQVPSEQISNYWR